MSDNDEGGCKPIIPWRWITVQAEADWANVEEGVGFDMLGFSRTARRFMDVIILPRARLEPAHA